MFDCTTPAPSCMLVSALQNKCGAPHRLDNRGLCVISETTAISQQRDPEHWLVSEERNEL